MARVTKRELHRRIAAARGEVSAMIFFLLPPKAERGRRRRFSAKRYAQDQQLKTLAYLLRGLMTGEFQGAYGNCPGCGKAVRGGQQYVHTEDAGDFHYPKCLKVDKRHVARAETQREQDAEARRHLKGNYILDSLAIFD